MAIKTRLTGKKSAKISASSRMGRRGAQLSFADSAFIKPGAEFGGSLLKGNPKTKRPLDSKKPIHLTLRSTRSVLRLPKTHAFVMHEVERVAKKYGIRIYKKANVGNHLHLLIRVGRLSQWAPFIRELTGRLAQGIQALGLAMEKFWSYRPHTRVVASWGKGFRLVKDYIYLNQLEGDGFISRRDMKTLRDLREFLSLVTGSA